MVKKKRHIIRRLVLNLLLSVAGFFVGILSSCLFYYFALQDTDLSWATKKIMFALTITSLSLGFAFSTQIRCVAALTVPEFVSTPGKRTIQAIIVLLVLSGPLKNMSKNGEEIVKMIGCFADMAYNLTQTSKDILLAPVDHIFHNMKTEQGQEGKKYNMETLKELFRPLQDEVEDETETISIRSANHKLNPKFVEKLETKYQILPSDSEAEKITKRYKKKLSYRCQDTFVKANNKCKEVFAGVYNDCFNAVTVALAWAFCWPFTLDLICDQLSVLGQDQTCSSVDAAGESIGETFLSAKLGFDDFQKNFIMPKIDYDGIYTWANAGLEDIQTNKNKLLEEFKATKAQFEYILELLKRLLAFTYLIVIFKALNYNGKYLENLSFDNHYITQYFERIDKRRESEGRSNLLPLKSFEKPDFITVIRLTLTPEERLILFPRLVAVLIQTSGVGTLLFLDYELSRLLTLFHHHADFEIELSGDHALGFSITGEGTLARLLRKIITGIDVSHRVKHVHQTMLCLPTANYLHHSYYHRLAILFGCLLLICYFELFARRIRHCVADFFYPKRSKRRIIWLYNEGLRRRLTHMEVIKRKLLSHADEKRIQVDYNIVNAMAEKFPRLCKCLHKWKYGRRKCLLCKEYGAEYKCEVCRFSYCENCFNDMSEVCLYCQARAEMAQKIQDHHSNHTHGQGETHQRQRALRVTTAAV